MLKSVNNHLILEKYVTDGSLQTEIKNGFAFTKQKIAAKGLKVLVTTQCGDIVVPEGSIAYIREEDLHNKEWAKRVLSCDAIPNGFIVANIVDVLFISDGNPTGA
jgi:hypothetical protein